MIKLMRIVLVLAAFTNRIPAQDITIPRLKTDLGYVVQRHTTQDKPGQTGQEVPIFYYRFNRGQFRFTPKWDGKPENIPISQDSAKEAFQSTICNLLKGGKQAWKVADLGVIAINEASGDYVWAGYAVPVGGMASSSMSIPFYLRMDGQFMLPRSMQGKEAYFGAVFAIEGEQWAAVAEALQRQKQIQKPGD